MDSIDLSTKVALVTGASRGIGKAIALGFAAAGASLCCTARDEKALAAVLAEIHKLGGEAIAVEADVRDEGAVKGLMQQCRERFGGLDIIVVNAGIHPPRARLEVSDSEAWQATIDVNLIGAYNCIKHAIPLLRARGAGKIITLGSGLGHRGLPGGSAYACSKAALSMLTQVVAQELAEEPISINELIPGPVETGMLSDSFRKNVVEGQHEWLKEPEDVVPLALMLASQPDWGPSGQRFSLMRRVL